MSWSHRLPLLALLLCALAACGKKGPLYLPEPQAAGQPATADAAQP